MFCDQEFSNREAKIHHLGKFATKNLHCIALLAAKTCLLALFDQKVRMYTKRQ